MIENLNPATSNQDLKSTGLEAHVLLCQQRYQLIDERFDRVEARIDNIMEHLKSIKRLITGAILTGITGAIGATASLAFDLLKQ